MRPDAIVMRHRGPGARTFWRATCRRAISTPATVHTSIPPALLDARTILDRGRRSKASKWPSSATSAHSRVARSNVHLLAKFGLANRALRPGFLLPASWRNWRPA